jgi:WD40 repeat protein
LVFSEKGDYLASSGNIIFPLKCNYEGTDHGIILWKVNGKSVKKLWEVPHAHDSVVGSVTFGKRGSADLLISSSWDYTIKAITKESDLMNIRFGKLREARTTLLFVP